MKPSVFIFDLYGTLADIHTDETPAALWDDAAKEAARFGAVYTGPALKKAYLRLCADEVRLRAETLPTVPIAHVEPELLSVFFRLLKERGGDADERNAQTLARFFRKRSTRHIGLMPHALEVLDALRSRGEKTCLLSNAQACFTWDELRELDLYDRFDGILLSSDAGMKKPYRGLFDLL